MKKKTSKNLLLKITLRTLYKQRFLGSGMNAWAFLTMGLNGNVRMLKNKIVRIWVFELLMGFIGFPIWQY